MGEGRSPEELREYEQFEFYYDGHQEDGQYNTNPVQNDKNGIKRRNKLLVIVLDGFRWDYFSMYREKTGGKNLNYFQAFMKNGVRAQYLESVFPAESFPA